MSKRGIHCTKHLPISTYILIHPTCSTSEETRRESSTFATACKWRRRRRRRGPRANLPVSAPRMSVRTWRTSGVPHGVTKTILSWSHLHYKNFIKAPPQVTNNFQILPIVKRWTCESCKVTLKLTPT